MATATYSDVETVLARPIPEGAERTQVEWWLTGVELIIAAELGDVSLLNQDALIYVEAEAVAAKVRRRATVESSITVKVDDGSVTRRYEAGMSSGDITDEWWELLTGSRGSRGGVRMGWLL